MPCPAAQSPKHRVSSPQACNVNGETCGALRQRPNVRTADRTALRRTCCTRLRSQSHTSSPSRQRDSPSVRRPSGAATYDEP